MMVRSRSNTSAILKKAREILADGKARQLAEVLAAVYGYVDPAKALRTVESDRRRHNTARKGRSSFVETERLLRQGQRRTAREVLAGASDIEIWEFGGGTFIQLDLEANARLYRRNIGTVSCAECGEKVPVTDTVMLRQVWYHRGQGSKVYGSLPGIPWCRDCADSMLADQS